MKLIGKKISIPTQSMWALLNEERLSGKNMYNNMVQFSIYHCNRYVFYLEAETDP